MRKESSMCDMFMKVYKLCPKCRGSKCYDKTVRTTSGTDVTLPNSWCGECDEVGMVFDGYQEVNLNDDFFNE